MILGAGIFHDKLEELFPRCGRSACFLRGQRERDVGGLGAEPRVLRGVLQLARRVNFLRTRRHDDEFNRLWIGLEPGLIVESLDTMTRERLVDIAEDDIDRALREARSTGKARPQGRQLMPHQLAVLDSWRRSKCKGIVAFATGAGKTLTGLAAVKEWTASGRPALILVPGRELHRQWRAELALEMPETVPLLCGGGFGLTKWRDLLPLYTQVAPPGPDRRISVANAATFASAEFQSLLRGGPHLLVLADEMHHLGSTRNCPGPREHYLRCGHGIECNVQPPV